MKRPFDAPPAEQADHRRNCLIISQCREAIWSWKLADLRRFSSVTVQQHYVSNQQGNPMLRIVQCKIVAHKPPARIAVGSARSQGE
jgi:hypothetical protein